MPIIKIGIKATAAKNGIQVSAILNCCITNNPTDFTMPEAIINELAINAPSISVNFRPSKKLNTTPHIKPSGSPLISINTALYGYGTNPKPSKDKRAIPIKTMSVKTLFLGSSSAINLMPINLEITYPISCKIISATL